LQLDGSKIKIMKQLISILLLTITSALNAQENKLEKVWETDTIIAIPESVLPDPKRNLLFVSLIDGGGWNADGKGGVGKLSPDGSNYDPVWITGLNAPKGMGMIGDNLYVADMTEVIVIDILKSTIERRIAIESAQGLNDITVTNKGIIYVSDSRMAKIWRIENDRPSLFLDSMKGVNGLKAIGDDLMIGAGKNFMKAGKNKELTKIAELPQGIDGIEPVGNGDYILTSWSGYIFYLHANGKLETLLDTHLEKKNTADIGYNPAKRILYVPTFNAKTVVAYSLR
jgi:hypothetical protein